jgi:hypothetical protein
MKNLILSKEQIQELVAQNRYPVTAKNKFLSRCIDGRYENKLKVGEINLAALAIAGADLGELALIFATGNNFGFEVDEEKTFKTLIEVVGGKENFSWHTDNHADPKIPAGGCGHWRQINLDPGAYNLEKDQLAFIREAVTTLVRPHASCYYEVLRGEHLEGAVLLVEGNYSVMPRSVLQTSEGKMETEVFVYQATLVNQRHKILAAKLIENKAVKLFPGCEAEYLYEALSETGETHLFETSKRLAKGLPIYVVKFKDDGGFEIEEMGRV